MKTIIINDRTTKDLTEDELVKYLCFSGHLGSLEYFSIPIITDFEYDEKFELIFFEFYQIRISDNKKYTLDGQITITENSENDIPSIFVRNTNTYFNINDINFFIQLGFNMNLCSY